MGPVNIGISILEGNESSYKNGGIVRIHIGLFDTEKLTWVWITKNPYSKKTYRGVEVHLWLNVK